MNRPIILAATGLAAVVMIVALFWALQRRLMYFPAGEVPTPGDAGLDDVEVVAIETSDGLTLGGWFFAASGASPRITVLVFNGNAGNRAYRVPLAASLRQLGMQVLLTDYRGYGGNPGVPSESGLAADARAARAYLLGRPDVDPSRLVYFGESLGAAVAVGLAVEHPPAALILRSPFVSMVEMGRHHYPWLPVGRLLRDRFASIDRIGQIRSPLLVIAGGRDRIVPPEQSRRLFEAADTTKKLVVLAAADHNDHALLAGEEMMRAIADFLRQHDRMDTGPRTVSRAMLPL